MKLNIDAKAPRSGGTSTGSTRRSRSKLGQAMSEALRAIGGRKSEPGPPSPEALAQMARAQEQLARAKGILQLDRTLTAAERAVAEPSATSLQIGSWIDAEIAGLADASAPLDPTDFVDASGVMRVDAGSRSQRARGDADGDHGSTVPGPDVQGGHELADPALDIDALEPSDRPVLEILASVEMPALEASTEPALESAEIATSGRDGGAAGELSLADGLDAAEGEPIRTRTMARLLVSHGYFGRALTIYDHLLAQQPHDPELRAEADAARAALAQKTA